VVGSPFAHDHVAVVVPLADTVESLGVKDGAELLCECRTDDKGRPRQRPLAFEEMNRRERVCAPRLALRFVCLRA
jgi:hypothetical protein